MRAASIPRKCRSTAAIAALLTLRGIAGLAADAPGSLQALPARIELASPEATEQLVVFAHSTDGRTADLTRSASYASQPEGIVLVSANGQVVPLSDGMAEIRITHAGTVQVVPVEVRGQSDPPRVSFRRELLPILSKAGCNTGACHGKAEGQNGFKLSVFGYDPAADHRALVLEGRGRRVFRSSPEQSLLVLKGTALTPHGGGRKVEPGSRWHRLMERWVREGAVLDDDTGPTVAHIEVEPALLTLGDRVEQQIRVIAVDSDGRRTGVTAEADYRSNNEAIVRVDGDGLLATTDVPGEAAVLVRYLGQVAVCRVTHPRSEGEFERPAERTFVDRLVWDKLEHLRVPPSHPVDDATFVRRASLDVIGTLPTADEVRKFLADPDPAKRSRLVAELLMRPEYNDYWAQRWADLLRVDRDAISPQSAVAMTRWIRDQIARNVPYDQFARSILTVQGSTLSESPAAFYQVHSDPEKSARAISQLFLGVRIECAQCHHHPFERWDQRDYYSLAGLFTGIDRRPLSAGAFKIVSIAGSDLNHPRTGQPVPAAGLGAPASPLAPGQDRRQAFADWATGPENPYFARTIANRLWAHYLGRGLVEPIDDLRATNPASNEALLDALARHLVELRLDLRAFTQMLLDSQVYQLSSEVSESNRLDEQNYSHFPWKPLPAEVLLDAVSQATGVAEEFNGWPPGYRAIQLWDNKLPSHFLEVFGRPRRQTVCACERGTEPSIAQALHLMNSPELAAKIEDSRGRAAALSASDRPPAEIVDELFLATLSRPPRDEERSLLLPAFADPASRRAATEDVLWTLLNTSEFVFNH